MTTLDQIKSLMKSGGALTVSFKVVAMLALFEPMILMSASGADSPEGIACKMPIGLSVISCFTCFSVLAAVVFVLRWLLGTVRSHIRRGKRK